ncbi:MAG: hypothetical protein PHP31_05915, partial [Lentimicrobiaceae bacterium]|nr:hypothetical protein [Lentimicrobiaceae bacterium]
MKMIKMKNLILVLVVLFAFVGCKKEDNETAKKSNGPTTEVFVAGNKVTKYTDVLPSPAGGGGILTHDNAYFFIRIDGRIPGYTGSQNSSSYYPATSGGGTLCSALNNGSVLKNYPYNNLGGYMGMTEYVYDPTGQATQLALVNVPTLDNLLQAHQGAGAPLSQYFTGVDMSKIKFLWYVVKNRPNDWNPHLGATGRWNIDGVLTMDNVMDVRH